MRNNQPVTQREYVVRADSAIISHTDLKSLITYVNDDFLEASGYSREESLGQPHNLLRHPDMPTEAFRDIWATIQSGRPWQGLVKNRCKDGGFYWVKATISPLPDGSGYMSVRVKPDTEEVRQAEALYARMRGDSSIRLEEGQLVHKGLFAAIGRALKRIKLIHLVWMQVVLLILIEVALATLKFTSIKLAIDVAAALLAVLIAWVISRRMQNGFKTANDMIEGIASGDLIRPLPPPGKDEIGNILAGVTRMRNNLHGLVAALRQGVEKLGRNATNLNHDAQRGAASAQEQSDAAASMAASIEALSVSIDHVEGSAAEARQITESSGKASAEGSRVIRAAGEEVGNLALAVDESANTIRELEAMSEKISNIVSVIGDIADQTNLLALNAAIEAARAGEQGRGFAVVADEVRKLAERTSNSTREINSMISQIQAGTHKAVDQMSASVTQVEQSVALASQADEAISGIESASQGAVHATDEIAHALKAQSSAAKEIARNVESIAQATEAASALAGGTANLAGELNALAAELNAQVSRFKVSHTR